MITASNLGKRVPMLKGELTILKGIDLEIKAGESVAIVGASGSGKSTLLGLLAGLDTASEGFVAIDGANLQHLDEDGRAALRARDVGVVFQSFQLLPALTALDNVMLPLERVALAQRGDHYPRQLSGGEQQRVAIARAFAGSPRILFADEPTGNLDRASGERIAELLFALNREQGATLVLVTHDLNLARRCARCLRMDSGALSDAERAA